MTSTNRSVQLEKRGLKMAERLNFRLTFHISASFEAEASKIHKCFRIFSGFFLALELVCSVSLRGQRPPLGCR